jgi:integrative and conjugative element protein (TIGR02256 family)
MDEDWQSLPRGEALAGPHELRIPRAVAIADAAARHGDFTLLQCSRLPGGELLVVDGECHGVPPQNPMGIEFRERLALVVPTVKDKAIEVMALRRGFPRLMHQNAQPPGYPPSLCLYYEPQRSVMRTWTPENFLRRIQMWLEKSARGELHPADQPVEQLFFVASHELVLPWNVDELLQQAQAPVFEIIEGPQRTEGATYFMRPRPAAAANAGPKVALIQLTLPSVVHGRVEPDPPTLGGLVDVLHWRGVDLLAELKASTAQHVGTKGVPASQDASATLVLLHLPVARAEGQPPERVARRGYLTLHGLLKLGELTGSLFLHERVFYKEAATGLLSQPGEKAGWRDLKIEAVEVIRGLDRRMAKHQSGVADEGPRATLVGAGALGATVLDLWTRSGWGQWTVVDKDHMKPHNLVRHPADQRHLGKPKEQVAIERHHEIMNGASTATAVHGDACELVDGKPLACLQAAELVVDISTTLDYPRLMSGHDVGRHASLFLTPRGNASVVLLEDSARTTRLRTLEAQYYRAVIEQPWGADHLAGNHGTFWSGAGCRDISVVMPYSSVVAHAAVLSEQLRALVAGSDACIKVWTRSSDGAMTTHVVPVHGERRIRFDDLDLFIDEAVISKMQRLRQAHLPRETGGILLGYHDLNIGAIVVVDAMLAPADSVSTQGSFERGVQGVADVANEAHRRTAAVVGYIGEWHSHPPGFGADPSSDDFYQLAYLALGLSHDGLPAVSLIVAEKGELQILKASVQS